MNKLYHVASRARSPSDRMSYLYFEVDGQDGSVRGGWVTDGRHADRFTRDVALRHARMIRKQWRMPARVVPA